MRVWHAVPAGKDEHWQCITSLSGNCFLRTVRCVAWGVDGRSLAAACFDATATVLELVGGGEPRLEAAVSLEGHESEVKSVCYSASGGLLASASRDRSVWVWEVGLDFDYECVAVLNGHSGDVKCVAWHPESETLLSAGYDNEIRVWVEDEDDWFCLEQLTAHDDTVWAVAFDASGAHFVSVGGGGAVVVWQRIAPHAKAIGAHPRYAVVAHLTGVHDGPIYAVDWAPRSGHIATAGEDDAICVLRRDDGERNVGDGDGGKGGGKGDEKGDEKGDGKGDGDENGGEKRDGDGDGDGCEADGGARARLRTETDQRWTTEVRVPRAHSGPVNCVAWSTEDEGVLASCGDDGLVRIWRFGTA